jgi:hypothetical protein
MESPAEMANKPDQEYEDNKDSMNGVDEDDMEDMGDMDVKSKALTNLLKTSSVSSALAGHRYFRPLISLRRSLLPSWQIK